MNTPLDHHTREFNRLRERIASEFGLESDDEFVVGTVEGETDLAGLLVRMVRQARERTAQAEVCAEQIKALSERKKRHTEAAQKIRAMVADAMLESGLTKISPGDFTASVRMTKPGAEIVDETALPTFYLKPIQKYIPDRAAIEDEYARCVAEKDTFFIPGVVVSNGKPSLTVRT